MQHSSGGGAAHAADDVGGPGVGQRFGDIVGAGALGRSRRLELCSKAVTRRMGGAASVWVRLD